MNKNYEAICQHAQRMLKEITELSQIIDCETKTTFMLSASSTKVLSSQKLTRSELSYYINSREELIELLQLEKTLKDELKELYLDDTQKLHLYM